MSAPGISARGRSPGTAQTASLVVGLMSLLLVLWLSGLLMGYGCPAGVVPVNSAGNRLYLMLGAGMLALGLTLGRDTRRFPRPTHCACT